MSDDDAAIIAEYNALKSEMLERVRIRHQLLALTVTLAGAALAAAKDQPTAPLAFPVVGALITFAWVHNEVRGRQLGTYVRRRIESRVTGIGWETYYRHGRLTPKLIGNHFPLSFAGPFATFLGTELICLVVGLTQRAANRESVSSPTFSAFVFASGIAMVATVGLAFLAWGQGRKLFHNERTPTYVIFSDLDGTLLDHHTYAATEAMPGLRRIRDAHDLLVFCSSKTQAEQEETARALELPSAPMIVENGSAIVGLQHLPGAGLGGPTEEVLGLPIAEVRAALEQLCAACGVTFEAFSDAPVEVVVKATGLTPAQALLAQQRKFTETLLSTNPSNGEKDQELIKRAPDFGIKIVKGGRFLSAIGPGTDKGIAVTRVQARLEALVGRRLRSAGVGDAENDMPMLAAVEVPYLVQRHNATFADPGNINATRVDAVGPAGFTRAMEHFYG